MIEFVTARSQWLLTRGQRLLKPLPDFALPPAYLALLVDPADRLSDAWEGALTPSLPDREERAWEGRVGARGSSLPGRATVFSPGRRPSSFPSVRSSVVLPPEGRPPIRAARARGTSRASGGGGSGAGAGARGWTLPPASEMQRPAAASVEANPSPLQTSPPRVEMMPGSRPRGQLDEASHAVDVARGSARPGPEGHRRPAAERRSVSPEAEAPRVSTPATRPVPEPTVQPMPEPSTASVSLDQPPVGTDVSADGAGRIVWEAHEQDVRLVQGGTGLGALLGANLREPQPAGPFLTSSAPISTAAETPADDPARGSAAHEHREHQGQAGIDTLLEALYDRLRLEYLRMYGTSEG
jgi:hypothetical protein